MNDISGFSYKFIVAGLKVKKDFMCTKCCYLWTYLKIWAQMHYFSSSLVLAAVQQERQIQMWSTELAVYGSGCEQKSKFLAIWLANRRIAPILRLSQNVTNRFYNS